ncbi:MAG: phosphate signaling complex protein PhoU [Bdellovibrionaceae bacterium]|nr:phosphate signaling complex protein PhoU [Pseudobdellovibrionaceae bacterium]
MERTIDSQLDELKRLILVMGGHVEKALAEATVALMARNADAFNHVHDIEKKINEGHIAVDNACLSLLAKQGPVAKDLRMILSIVKINTDLERMGDQCVNIAYTGKDYLARKPLNNLADVTKMSEVVRAMVKESLDCFVRGDVDLAKRILLMDDEVDGFRNKIFKDQLGHMKITSEDVEASLDIILVARNLERLGDHATNIAEDVIFAFTGKDVRHGGKFAGA